MSTPSLPIACPLPASEGGLGASARCAQCAQPFLCQPEPGAACACMSVALGAQSLALLRERFTGCLCVGCLRAFAALQESGARHG